MSLVVGGYFRYLRIDCRASYRLEFFGDEIDGIRQFDSDSQKSLNNLEHVVISPADDIILTREDYQRAEKALESAISRADGLHKAYLEEVLSVTIDGHRHKDLRKFLSLFMTKLIPYLTIFQKGLLYSLMIFKR